MFTLSAKIRKDLGKRVKNLRKKGIIPAVLYGPNIRTLLRENLDSSLPSELESLPLEINLNEFEKVYQGAGESSLISLNVESKEFLVLIHATEINVISRKPIHVDFYQPKLDEEIEVAVPLVFEGEALAVNNLGGTLVKNIYELEVKALPQNLPHEIKVDISKLKTFEDDILIKDLIVPKEAKILKEPDETVAFVSSPEKIEEELEKPIEEKVEEVEEVGKKKEAEEEVEKTESTAKIHPAAKTKEKTK